MANILFLEDDRNIREVTCEYLLLERHSGYYENGIRERPL